MTDDEKYLAVIDRMIDLEQALRAVLELHAGPCRIDHEGYCQNHGVTQPCVVADARRVLASSTHARVSADPEADRLRVALGHYADEKNWKRTRYDHLRDPLDRFTYVPEDGDGDGYDVARAALAG